MYVKYFKVDRKRIIQSTAKIKVEFASQEHYNTIKNSSGNKFKAYIEHAAENLTTNELADVNFTITKNTVNNTFHDISKDDLTALQWYYILVGVSFLSNNVTEVKVFDIYRYLKPQLVHKSDEELVKLAEDVRDLHINRDKC